MDSVQKDPLNKSNEPYLVLISHSISASVVAAAISAWKQQQLQQKQQLVRQVENLLHQALSVVTFGNLCQSFCDGLVYVVATTTMMRVVGGTQFIFMHVRHI